MARKPWALAAWRKQREKLLEGATCAWCGSAENLVVHHTHETRNTLKRIARPIIRDLIREKVDSGEVNSTKTVLTFICPECGSSQDVKGSVTTTCKNCRTRVKLDQVEMIEVSRPNYYIGREGYKEFLKQYASEIEARVKAQSGTTLDEPEYTDLEQETVILCNRCHLALHKGMRLCPVCKQRYTRYGSCYTCLPEAEKARIQERYAYERELEEEDMAADDWFSEFESATPERREEMLREQDERCREEMLEEGECSDEDLGET